jgi:hypothetical protein
MFVHPNSKTKSWSPKTPFTKNPQAIITNDMMSSFVNNKHLLPSGRGRIKGQSKTYAHTPKSYRLGELSCFFAFET